MTVLGASRKQAGLYYDKGGAVLNAQHPDFGAKADGVTDDTAALQAWGSAMEAAGHSHGVIPPSDLGYKISSTVAFTLPEHSTVRAHGARFTCTHDGVAFDLNPGAVWDGSDTTTKRKTVWEGGHFVNTNVSKTASAPIKAYHLRHFVLDHVRAENFWAGLLFAGKDSYFIDRSYFFNCVRGIYHPAGVLTALGDAPLEINVSETQFAACTTACIAIYEKYQGLKIRDNSFNAACARLIDLRDSTLLYSEGTIIEANHFEQMGNGQYAVYCDDSNGQGFYGFKFHGNTVGSGTVGWKGLGLHRVRGIDIGGGNVFRDGSGGSTEVVAELDANCRDIKIDNTNQYLSIATAGLPQINASIPRSSYTVLPEYRTVAAVVTGYNGASFSTGNATIDMSAALAAFPTFGVPKGYMVSLTARDSASAASTTTRVVVQKSSGGVVNNALRVGLENVPNNTKRNVTGYVECDANGDIYIDQVASGASTMVIDLWVQAIIM